ncbi:MULTISPECIES: hypothetical protein [unclassified Crossiella]|uniref:hypothetical protein n=1 Tax=unclassified Crossiella TaxID=2620835 RepID=UPI001FFFC654|nr:MULTISPECIES: hypothetical protein [unclassified Crossiella]MCK2244425.1 hypothetical protein [Crossiella sp. S99.2]MCK2257747.1 hypothetical protein [Crossiella sp. S99.1]
MTQQLPPVAEPFQLPFHYGALHHVGLDYLVEPAPVAKVLARTHPGLSAAEFDGRACVSVNFQLYFAQYAAGAGITQEIEINVIAFPRGDEHRLAELSYVDYASGVDQTKLLGIGRIHVLCDNDIAIEAGTKLYAEPKYPARFTAVMPSLNGPRSDTWAIGCQDTADRELFGFTARLDGLPGEPVNNTPITGYGTTEDGRLLAGPMNVYHPYRLHLLDNGDRVSLTITDQDSPVCQDLAELIGAAPAAGVWTYQSAPVAAHNRPYYLPAPR